MLGFFFPFEFLPKSSLGSLKAELASLSWGGDKGDDLAQQETEPWAPPALGLALRPWLCSRYELITGSELHKLISSLHWGVSRPHSWDFLPFLPILANQEEKSCVGCISFSCAELSLAPGLSKRAGPRWTRVASCSTVPTELAPGKASSSLYSQSVWDERGKIHQQKRQKSGWQGEGNPQIAG